MSYQKRGRRYDRYDYYDRRGGRGDGGGGYYARRDRNNYYHGTPSRHRGGYNNYRGGLQANDNRYNHYRNNHGHMNRTHDIDHGTRDGYGFRGGSRGGGRGGYSFGHSQIGYGVTEGNNGHSNEQKPLQRNYGGNQIGDNNSNHNPQMIVGDNSISHNPQMIMGNNTNHNHSNNNTNISYIDPIQNEIIGRSPQELRFIITNMVWEKGLKYKKNNVTIRRSKQELYDLICNHSIVEIINKMYKNLSATSQINIIRKYGKLYQKTLEEYNELFKKELNIKQALEFMNNNNNDITIENVFTVYILVKEIGNRFAIIEHFLQCAYSMTELYYNIAGRAILSLEKTYKISNLKGYLEQMSQIINKILSVCSNNKNGIGKVVNLRIMYVNASCERDEQKYIQNKENNNNFDEINNNEMNCNLKEKSNIKNNEMIEIEIHEKELPFNVCSGYGNKNGFVINWDNNKYGIGNNSQIVEIIGVNCENKSFQLINVLLSSNQRPLSMKLRNVCTDNENENNCNKLNENNKKGSSKYGNRDKDRDRDRDRDRNKNKRRYEYDRRSRSRSRSRNRRY